MNWRNLRLYIIACFLAAQSVLSAAIIEFTVTGTANSTGLGYNTGQSVSFTYTLNDYAPTSPTGSTDGSTMATWREESTSEPELWSNVRGTGLSGAWTRPATTADSPLSYVEIHSGLNGEVYLFAGTDKTAPYDTGITVNGYTVQYVYMGGTYSGLNFAIPGTLPNPATYFANHLGAYSETGSGYGSVSYDGGFLEFTPTSLAISSVPEPSTWVATGFLGALLLGRFGWRLLGKFRTFA